MITVLIPCTFYTGYVVQLRDRMKKYYPEFRISVLTSKVAGQRYLEEISDLEDGEQIYTYEKKTLIAKIDIFLKICELPSFDIVHFLWMETNWGLFVGTLRKKAGGVFISVGGSDLYRDSQKHINRMLQKRLIRRANLVSSENTQTRDCFMNVYGKTCAKIPHRIIRFGVDIIDAIIECTKKKEEIKAENGISKDSIVIVCGYNASKEHQHDNILESIAELDKVILDKIYIVIPMTYGVQDEGYLNHIRKKVSDITHNYEIKREYMNVSQMAELVMMADIFIHVQTTDQLSSIMMANMYNGNIVIAGSWLPYDEIRNNDVFFRSVDDFGQLRDSLYDIINNIDYYLGLCSKNSDNVYRMSSWEYCIKEWHAGYKYILEKSKNNL